MSPSREIGTVLAEARAVAIETFGEVAVQNVPLPVTQIALAMVQMERATEQHVTIDDMPN